MPDQRSCHGPVKAALGLVLVVLALCLSGAGHAASASEGWRGEARRIRILAENDPSSAYQQAQRLQANLPVGAPPADQAQALNLLARTEVYLALTDDAARHAQLALDLAVRNADRVGQTEAHLNVVLNAINQAKIDVSVAAATQSMERVEGIDRPDLLGEALLRMAMMYRRLGDMDSSVTLTMQAMELAKRGNSALALTYAHQGLAISFEQSGHYARAREQYQTMRDQARIAQSKMLEAHAVQGLALVAANLGDAAGAERLMREAVVMLRSLRAPFSLCHGLFGLADVLRKQGRPAQAVDALDEAVAIYAKYPNRIGLWFTLTARSAQLQVLHRMAAARADAERAHALAKEIDVAVYLSGSARRLAELAAIDGDYQRAYQLSAEASATADKSAREKSGARMIELAQRYESESKQRAINTLNLLNERQGVELQKQALNQRWLLTVLVGGVIALLGISYFLLHLRRSNRKLGALNCQVEKSRNQLRATLDAVPDPLFVLGLDGHYYECHYPLNDLLAAPVEDLIGKTVSDVMPPEAAGICLAALREAHEQGRSIGRQIELPLACGISWFELSVARKHMEPGDEPRFIVLSRDITARKRAEELLHAREQEFRALVEHSPDHIARYDAECRRTYVNPVMLEQFGLPADKVLGSTPLEVAALQDAQAYVERLQAVLKTGQESRMEFRYHDVHGGARWGDMRLVPEFGLDGAVTSVLAVSRDITERMRMEEALRERERRYRGIFDNVLDTLYLLEVTPDGRFRNLEVNPAFEKSSGMSSAELIGKFIEETVPKAVADTVIAKYRKCVEAGTVIHEEATLDLPNGVLSYHSTLVPVRDDRGRIHRIVGISRDITESKRLERNLEESQRLLRQLAARNESAREDERRRLKREIHDELGQYLLALRLGLSVMGIQFRAVNPNLEERVQRLIEMVDSTIKVVRNVVASLRPTALDLGIVSALEWLVGEYSEKTGTQCELHVAQEDISMDDASATAIFRIAQESLTNTVRHAKASWVRMALERHGDEYMLEVRDNGVGFDAALRKDKSFGLVSIRERALMLGGEVDISSTPGHGTLIQVHIPIDNAVTNALNEP